MSFKGITRTERLKLLFAGGCHVTGFHAGESDSFPAYTAQTLGELGIETDIHRLPHTKLSHRRRVLEACGQIRPDVLVLQLGHAELNQTLSHYVKARFRIHEPNSSPDSDTIPSLLGNHIAFQVRTVAKWLIDYGLGHPLADFNRLAASWDSLLTNLGRAGLPLIVVLSPLPCADWTRMYYRKRGNPLYREAAARHHCEFIDLLALTDSLHSRRFGPSEFHYDGMHLGSRGMRAVGGRIATAIAEPARRMLLQGSR